MTQIASALIETAQVPLSRLHPAPWNPRLIKDKRFQQLCQSLQADPDFLWERPILATADGTIYGGNMRYRAAEHLKWATVPARLADLTDAQAKARALRDNNSYGEWQEQELAEMLVELQMAEVKLDTLGFPDDELARLLDSVGALGDTPTPEAQIDRAAELQAQWSTALGQLWVIPSATVQGQAHRLLCGDSTDAATVARLMDGRRAALCFTSPPYAQQRDYGAKIADWDGLMRGVFQHLPMADDGQVLVNLGLVHRDNEWQPYWDGWVAWMREQGWRRFGWYVWDQGTGLQGDWAGRLAPCFEFVFHFNRQPQRPAKTRPCKTAGRTNRNAGLRDADGTRAQVTTVVQPFAIPDAIVRGVSRETSPSGDHPAAYPVGLPAYFAQAWPGDIYEPFSGSGTTMLASEQTGRLCYGLEIEPKYVAVALERLKAAGLRPERADG